MPTSPRPTRRGLLAAGGATVLGAALAACGSSGGSSGGGSGSGNGGGNGTGAKSAGGDGGWSFTDDRGTVVTAKARPGRVVAFTGAAAALADFGLDKQLVGVFGETRTADGKADPQAGDLDLGKVEIIGNAWGEFSIEKYAALRPELLVTHMYDKDAYWYVPDESKAKILPLAPQVLISTGRVSITQPIEHYAKLAEALGADPKAPKVVDAKARFERASEELRQAAKAAGGVRVMACSGSADLFYVSNPKVSCDLIHFAELGVQFVQPEKTDGGDYYEGLSWENAGKYPADLLLLDQRPTALQPKDLTAKPAWGKLPAVQAGQLTPWDAVPRFSYAGFAPLLERLTAAIQKSRKLS
ncbi:ABC transporter substrate-binding protein [Kitasatospora sp. NPDC088134]|uniref:ABC transporter substrate-binding protein n=1 Tax=Kitasatospora sp. NPDC088134 TaxID=3364071 RepID=UPI0037F31BC9